MCTFGGYSRIKKSKEISSLIRSGQNFKGKTLSIYYSKKEYEFHRFAVLVGKKHGSAVVRNRLKRILRAIIQKINLEGIPPLDILLLPSKEKIYTSKEYSETYAKWKNSLSG